MMNIPFQPTAPAAPATATPRRAFVAADIAALCKAAENEDTVLVEELDGTLRHAWLVEVEQGERGELRALKLDLNRGTYGLPNRPLLELEAGEIAAVTLVGRRITPNREEGHLRNSHPLPTWARSHFDQARPSDWELPKPAPGYNVTGINDTTGEHHIESPWYELPGHPLYTHLTHWLLIFPREGRYRVTAAYVGRLPQTAGLAHEDDLPYDQAEMVLRLAFGKSLEG